MRLRLMLFPTGLALGAISLGIARADPGFSFAGTSLDGAVALLGAGWALLACAFVFLGRRPENVVGPLLVAVGCVWFLAEWDNPGVGSSLVFTIGLVFYAACPPLAAWAMFAYPTGRLGSWAERVTIGVALANAMLVLGFLPTVVFDPAAQGCAQCPRNLLLVTGQPGMLDDLNAVGVRTGLASMLVLIVLACWRLARSSRAKLLVVTPVVLAGTTFLGVVSATFAASLDRGFLGSSALERRLWLAQAIALMAFAGAVGWGLFRVRRVRAALARLVVELGEPAAAGDLRDALARTLADSELEVAYPIGEGRFADARGRSMDVVPGEGRAATPLVRDGRPVAYLVHRADLVDNPALVEEVALAARLALENERLQAEARVQLEDLRSSRARIIEAGDAERRRLERDLHDGAQQRLIGVSLALRLQRTQLATDQHRKLAARLDVIESKLGGAVAELRELAHGIHPAVLSDEGIAAAVEALTEGASAPLHINTLPKERFPQPIETAAYLLVAEATKAGTTGVSATSEAGLLVIDVETRSEPDGLIDLEDRVGALKGRLSVEPAPGGGIRIHAEIPCE